MTTIAANRQCMSADSKVVLGETTYLADKMYVIGNSIIGAAGPSHHIAKFVAWYRDGMPSPAPELPGDKEFDAHILVLNEEGLFLYVDFCEGDKLLDPFYAVGVGAMAALSELHRGSTPEEAVEMACIVNSVSTGRPIKTLWLKDIIKPARKTRARR